MYIPRLRRLNQAIKEIKEQDPKSEISYFLFIQMIKKKEISAIMYGNSWLVNIDEIYKFFKTKDKK